MVLSLGIRFLLSNANAYYNPGFTNQRLGDKEGAIKDWSQAIRIDRNYAEAYQSRGFAYADIGDRKRAVKDLCEATKLFFGRGDVANYKIVKNLGKNFHKLHLQTRTNDPEAVAIECLFST